MWNQVEEIMQGACDLHVHAGPDVVPRQHSMIEVAQEANKCGMRALAFKDHNTTTADRVTLVQNLIQPSVELIGGVVLNYAVGGFNPEAVEKALKLGARIVWMPSMDAALTIEKVHVTKETPWLEPHVKLQDPNHGLTVLNSWPSGEEILPEVKDILKIIEENDAVLDTCHLSAYECSKLIDEAVKIGIKKIIVTHPNCSVNPMSANEQKELADKGAYISYAFLPCMPLFDRQHPKEIAIMMHEVGMDRCLLFSDFGQIVNPSPVEGYKMFIGSLLGVGLAAKDLKEAACSNPVKLLGLE
jgi:hypothetical protein